MACTGTVKSWRKAFGFAESEDGKTVYIHQSEIDGGRLRVGLKVNFDVEEVEGHDGRVKGTNVSGEAVLAKDAKLSEEEIEAEKKRFRESRDEKKSAQKDEYDAIKEQVDKLSKSVKLHLTKQLMKEFDMNKVQENKGKEETRPDPTDKTGKQQYTQAEYLKFYGAKIGPKMWDLAKDVSTTGGSKRRGGKKA